MESLIQNPLKSADNKMAAILKKVDGITKLQQIWKAPINPNNVFIDINNVFIDTNII